MQYTETQLTKLIEDVEKEFTAHLAKAEETSAEPETVNTDSTILSKAEEDKPFKPEEKEEPKAEAKPDAEKPSEEAEPAAEEHAEEAKPESEEPKAEAAPHSEEEACDYDEEDMKHLEKMYMSMSKAELKVHHDILAKCGSMMQEKAPAVATKGMIKGELKDENSKLNSKPTDKGEQLFNDKKNGGIEGCAPHNALGPKSAASDANGAKINKSEHDRRNGGKQEQESVGKTPGAKSAASDANGARMNKSEETLDVELLKSELSTEKAKFEDLKKNFDAVAAFLTKLVEKKAAPAAKAITSLDIIAKSEDVAEEKDLTKVEIHNILLKKSSEPTLKKADREAINVYYAEGQIDTKGINHLLN